MDRADGEVADDLVPIVAVILDVDVDDDTDDGVTRKAWTPTTVTERARSEERKSFMMMLVRGQWKGSPGLVGVSRALAFACSRVVITSKTACSLLMIGSTRYRNADVVQMWDRRAVSAMLYCMKWLLEKRPIIIYRRITKSKSKKGQRDTMMLPPSLNHPWSQQSLFSFCTENSNTL